MEIVQELTNQYILYIPVALVIVGAILLFTFGFKSAEQPPFDKLANEERKSLAGKKRKIKDKQIPQKDLTFADLVQMKMQNNYKKNSPMMLSEEVKQKLQELGNVFVDRPNLSKGARLKRNKRLRELGVWSLWNNLQQSKAYLAANGASLTEKLLTKGARRRLRKMREQGLTHAQIHKVAIERHLTNNWSEVAVQTRYKEISTCMVDQTPYFNDVEQNRQEIGSSLYQPSATCPTQLSHCGYNASGNNNATEDTVRYLQVTIVPEGYPNVRLNQEQAEMIKNALLAKIDMLSPGTIGPKFSDINLREGAIVVACLDNNSQRGIKLTISKQVTAVTWIPGHCEEPEVILRRMRVQNESLFTESWRILERTVNDMGQELVVSMEESEWRKIEDIGCMPYVNFSRVLFTALQ